MKKKNLHINNSYNTWSPKKIKKTLISQCENTYNNLEPCKTLNRYYGDLTVEWWLHNIGYYTTKPFTKNKYLNYINKRCKDVDLEEWRYK